MSGPPPRESAKQSPHLDGLRQVVMLEGFWEGFVDWVYDRGLHIFRIPVDDGEEPPSYAIGVPEELLRAALS